MHIGIVETSTTGAGRMLLAVARQKGYKISLFSRDPAVYPQDCLAGLERIVRCDTSDLAALFSACDELDADLPLQGITTVADLFVPQAAFLAEQFRLPGMPVRAACGARNKYLMRRRLAERAPSVTVRFALTSGPDQALDFLRQIGGPIIAKPQNANDSLGVRRLQTSGDVEAYFERLVEETGERASRWIGDGILVEEYLDGPEYSLEVAIPKGGPPSVLGACDKTLFGVGEGRFAEIGVSFPYRGPEVKAIEEPVLTALAAMEIDCGVIHTECRVTSDGVKIVEINPRLAGDMVGSHAIAGATGRSPLEAVLDIALGRFDGWNAPRSGGGAMYALTAPRIGTFLGISNLDQVRAMPGVVEYRAVASVGQLVRPPRENGEVLAQFVAVGADHREAHERARAAAEACEVVIEEEMSCTALA